MHHVCISFSILYLISLPTTLLLMHRMVLSLIFFCQRVITQSHACVLADIDSCTFVAPRTHKVSIAPTIRTWQHICATASLYLAMHLHESLTTCST
jgi:hypothetical protein